MTGAIAVVANATIAAGGGGGGGGSVAITNQTISKAKSASIGPAIPSYSINSSGTVTNQGTVLESWLKSGTASSYDVMATYVSGVALNGTTGTWLNCGSNQTWSITNSAGDNSTISSQFLVQIRLSSSGIVQTSATITLNATSSP